MSESGVAKGIRFDLRTKIIILVVVNALLFISKATAFEWVLTGSCLVVVALGGQPRSALRFFLFFASMMLVELAAMPYLNGFIGSLILFVAIAVRKVLPCLIIGKWILTSTEASEFVATMWRLRLPQDVVIPISVVFRYFPTLREEWQSLRMAMRMRGIGLSVEHVVVPLMLSAVTISDELSAAALYRGLDNPEGHSCLRQIRFALPDYLGLLFYLLLIAGVLVLKVGGAL
jgi:energy-coupling factor transport system permease protein